MTAEKDVCVEQHVRSGGVKTGVITLQERTQHLVIFLLRTREITNRFFTLLAGT